LRISNDIRIYIVEDDKVQSRILHDKLLEYNPEYTITVFDSGSKLLETLNNGYKKYKFNYIILDYYLQTSDDEQTLNGFEIIKALGEQHPKIKIVLFSAYDNDGDSNFKKLKEEPNVIEFVKKSEHAYSQIQNIFRFDYANKTLLKKKRRFQWVLSAFLVLLTVAVLHFLLTFLSF